MKIETENIDTLLYKLKNEDSYDCFDIDDLVSILEYCSDCYYNSDGSPISDELFDSLEKYLYSLDKTNEYFIGVGSEVRGEKVKLPYPMGGLTQIEIGSIEKWVNDNYLQDELLIISDKMDGVSCLLIYGETGEIQIAYSRGDGINAHDITRHISKIPNIPKKLSGKMVVRGEIEISNSDFKKAKLISKGRSGKEYKNPRNCCAGLMNAEENNELIYNYLTFIAYSIVDSKDSKLDQIDKLNSEGFETVKFIKATGGAIADNVLSEHIKTRKKELDFEIDGIVIEVNDAMKRKSMCPTTDTLNPKHTIKYKVTDSSNIAIATVKEVEWNVSKHGFLKPRINIEPIDLVGVTIQYATGFNGKFIYDKNIGPGAKIKIQRSGDVIPHVLGVVEPANSAQMPRQKYHWNETGVEIIIDNYNENEDVMIEQTLSFFAALDVPQLKEGNIRTMFNMNNYENSTDAIRSMLHYERHKWTRFIGENGGKIYNGLLNKFSELPLHALMGGLPYFGVGLGSRKFKKLINSLKITNIDQIVNLTEEDIISVDSFEKKTAEKVLFGIPMFVKFFNSLPEYANIVFFKEAENSSFKGKTIVFTGFRDAELQTMVERNGGEVKTSVSSKTSLVVAANPDSDSGKAQKARDLGIEIIGIDDLKKLLGVNVSGVIKNVKKDKKSRKETKNEMDEMFEF